MNARLRATAVVVLCCSFTLSFAQQPTPSPRVDPPQQQQKSATPQPSPSPVPSPEPPDELDVVKITTNLVQIDAVVTDKKGNRVTDLRADEVEMPLNTYLKGVTPEKVDSLVEQLDQNANPAVRQFHTGQALLYGFDVYNAKLDKTTKKPQLKTQVRVFRNGEQIFVGNEISFDPDGQKDLKRLQLGGAIQLGAIMTAGEYILQLIVTDMLASEKKRATSQWMSFDISN